MMEDQSSEYSDEEVGVVVGDKKLWVRGVRPETTCADIVTALIQHKDGVVNDAADEWILAERWRGVERPLPSEASVLGVLEAWGDAKNEVRLRLRRSHSESEADDSGRESVGSNLPSGATTLPTRMSRRRRAKRSSTPPPHAETLARLIAVQTKTIHQQIDKLREQENQIDRLEDRRHKTRMEKHGRNYLLDTYLRDLAAIEDQHPPQSENIAMDSQTGNSDSGVGGTGTPPRLKSSKKSRRERHLMREHYFTKELTDICQENADRFQPIRDAEVSSDELNNIKEEIELWEKMVIINRRLQREEELVVRLSAKLERYADVDDAVYCEAKSNTLACLERLDKELQEVTDEMKKNTAELSIIDSEISMRSLQLEELALQLRSEEEKQVILERSPCWLTLDNIQNNPLFLESSVDTCAPVTYPLDTLV